MPSFRFFSRTDEGDRGIRSFAILREHPAVAAFFYASVIAAAVVPALQVVVLREFTNDLGHGDGDPRRFTLLLGVFCALLLTGTVANFLSATLSATLAHRIIAGLQRRMFDRLTTMPLAFYTTVRPGAVVSRMTNDVNGIEDMFTKVLPTIVSSVVAITVSAVLIALVEPMFLLLVLLIPVMLAVVRRAETNINSLINDSFDITRRIASTTESLVSRDGILLARQSGRDADERRGFFSLTRQSTATSLRIARSAAATGVAYSATFGIATAIALGTCVSLALRGRMSVGDVVLTALIVQQLQPPVQALLGTRYPKLRARIAFGRVFDVLDSTVAADRKALDHERSVAVGRRPVSDVKLSMRRVSFAYPPLSSYSVEGLSQMGDVISIPWLPMTGLVSVDTDAPEGQGRPVLEDFDLEIRAGEVKAIVGPSGSGKSTVTLLAAGMLEPTAGEVRIAGHDLFTLNYLDLADRVAFITQDTFVLHDSIRANLRYAKPDATDEEILDACASAQLLAFVKSQDGGLDAVVGEKGNRMSGGERQRLSIARALLKEPEIVILDEATAHLDHRTETEVMEAVLSAFATKAILVIAHRLRTVAGVSEILVVEHGTVVQRGTYAQLVEDRNGPFSRLAHTTE